MKNIRKPLKDSWNYWIFEYDESTENCCALLAEENLYCTMSRWKNKSQKF